MVAGACALALAALPGTLARADSAPAQVNLGIGQASTAQPESVVVKAQQRLLREKNSPSAVTELGSKQIAAVGISGSTASLLRQAPSIYVYQQGIGDNAPVLTVRGLRGLEVATTLDGVPTQDLLAPGSFYLANNLGGVVTLSQIAGVSIYPGVAYPDKNTFGTIGGTIAYDSKRPSNDFYFDVTGEVGSFGTFAEGFELNSGAYDSPLGTGDNAAKVLLNYRNLQTQGFIDGTPNRENEMEFAFDKPYNDGQSKFQATVLYNTGSGLIENEPVPTAYLAKNGLFSNYPTNLDFAKQNNDFLTIILKNDTQVNDYLKLGLSAFYLGNDNQLQTYGDINLDVPGGVQGPLNIGGSSPFINNPGGFGEGGYYGPPTGGLSASPPYARGGVPLGIFGGGYGGLFYGRYNTYNPYKLYPAGSKECPNNIVNLYGGVGYAPCGLNDQTTISHSDTYGLQPRAELLVPEIFGIANTIKIGGLFAKETSPTGQGFLGGDPNSPLDAAHATSNNITGGTQRTIYQGYIQDKIDLFDDTLHLTPGGTVEGTFSSLEGGDVYRSKLSPYYTQGGRGTYDPNTGLRGTAIDRYGFYKATKWDREYLPFFNVSYDFDKILPALKGLQVYGSFGDSALFAPVGDFGPNTAGPPPFASIVHLYEGGVKYIASNLVLSADYFYQKIDRDFGFYSSQTGASFGQSVYSSSGQREFKGVEAAATYQVTPGIQLFGNVSHLLAKYLTSGLAFDTVAEDQYGVAIKGTPVTGIPDWLSTFGVDYNRKSTFLDNDGINVRLTGQYTGHQNTTYDLQGSNVYIPGVPGVDYSGGLHSNSVFDTFTGATTYDPHGGISPFTTFSLDAAYTLPTPYLPLLKKVTFDANVQNIFDQHYFQYFYKQVSPPASVATRNVTDQPWAESDRQPVRLHTAVCGWHSRPALQRVLHGHGTVLSLITTTPNQTRKAAPTGAAFFMSATLLATAAQADCGTLVIPSGVGQGAPDAVTSLNPLIGPSTYNQQSALLLYRPLIWVGQNGQPDPARSLAQSVTVNAANTQFTLTLKPWRWSDGTPVTSDDVLYAYSLITELGPAYAFAGQGGIPDRIASVTAPDATHISFTLRAPANPAWFELAALSVIPALPRHAWGPLSRDELWQRQTDPTLVSVVDGPFKLERFTPDQSISYVPNPLYGGHRSTLSRLVIAFLEGANPLHALRAGEIDMAQIPPALWEATRTLAGTTPLTLPEPFGYLALIPNLRRPFFAEARLRRALAEAIDQQAMVALVYYGASAENRVPIPADAPQFRAPAGALPVRYDPARARALLDQAGWLAGANGIRARAGVAFDFTILYSADAPERTALLQILQQNLASTGVGVHLRPVGMTQLLATAAAPEGWDAILLGQTLTGLPDGTSYFDTNGANNPGGYSNARMDALIARSTAEPGLDALYAYQDYFAAEQPALILPEGSVHLLVGTRVLGVADFVNAEGYLSPEYLSDAFCK